MPESATLRELHNILQAGMGWDGMETSQAPVPCERTCLGSSKPRDPDPPRHIGESDTAFYPNKSLGIPNFQLSRCSIAPPAHAPVNA